MRLVRKMSRAMIGSPAASRVVSRNPPAVSVFMSRHEESPLRAWTSAATWNKYDGTNSWTAAGGDFVDSAGNVYVADTFNDRIQKLSGTGEPLAQWGVRGSAPGQFNGPRGVAVSPNGASVYVTNATSNNVSQYDVGAGGALTPKSPATVASGTGPYGVAASPDGASVYVTAASSNAVDVFRRDPGGALTKTGCVAETAA